MRDAADPAGPPGAAAEEVASRFLRELAPLREALLAGLRAFPAGRQRESYLTCLLIRLAFLQFLQQAGFLCGDRAYLRRALASWGDGFYAGFFIPLALDGLGKPPAERGEFGERLRGAPSLRRSPFAVHPAEEAFGLSPERLLSGPAPDAALPGARHFEIWLDLLDRWTWRLDAAGSDDRTVTPAVLGCLFERLLHDGERGARGAFYTAADVSGMMCRTALIPQLLAMLSATGAAGRRAAAAFVPRGASLSYAPAGLLSPARLPRETAREQRARAERVARLRRAEEEGRLRTADDAVTWNLDLPALATGFIERIGDPSLLVALYRDCLCRLTALDPACGTGAFLEAAVDVLVPLYEACLGQMEARLQRREPIHPPIRSLFECEVQRARSEYPSVRGYACFRVLEENLRGIDLMPEAVEVCRLRLLLRFLGSAGAVPGAIPNVARTVVCGDFLQTAPHPASAPLPRPHAPASRVDVVIANPPYVETPREMRKAGCPYPNLYACFVERAFEILAKGGRCAMIVPVSCISGADYAPLMRHVLRGRGWISSYSNRPGKLFAGVEQRLAIFLAAPDEAPELQVAAYQHWYREERLFLFDRLEYTRGSVWRSGFPVKTGSALAERVFAKIARHSGGPAPAAPDSPYAVWVHDGPTYWVRALPFEPNAGSGRTGRSHYARLPVTSEEEARVMAAILNSTLFYFYFKMVSNCRDLGRREIESFPIDPLPPERRKALADSAGLLSERLQETAEIRCRDYPSGLVSYEEYYPARAWNVIQEIDHLLAVHYGLDADELDFLLHYDLKYRLTGRAGHRRGPLG